MEEYFLWANLSIIWGLFKLKPCGIVLGESKVKTRGCWNTQPIDMPDDWSPLQKIPWVAERTIALCNIDGFIQQ
jgi:hypothetical protein